ncbi:MAG: sulfatase-like hydrolase/transferase, partial [Verrucomicrobia bacterium]|nr:sulfatase-like hydrolase/transferase [Verrucomicrobiota bacterium]
MAALVNQWSLGWLLHRRVDDISPTTRQNVAIFEVVLVVGALVWLRWGAIRQWLGGRRADALKNWLAPRVPSRIRFALVVFMLPPLVVAFLGFSREDVALWHPLALMSGIESALFTSLLLTAVYWTVLTLSGRRWLAALALTPWLILIPVDLIALWTAGMRFEPRMIGWSSMTSIMGVISPTVCAMIVVPLVLICLAVNRLGVLKAEADPRLIYRLWLAVAVLGFCQPAYVCYRILSAPVPVRFLGLSQSIWTDVQKYRSDSVVHALRMVLTPKPYRLVKGLSPNEAAMATAIGIAPKPVPAALPLATPFKRVIFLTCESLGMKFIGRYNSAMPVSLTPFLDSLPESFLNFWACSFPTNAGLATHYCSHPNYTLLLANRYPNSFVKQLASAGWRTVLFRSAALSFSSGERRFTEIGFGELFGAEWQQAQGRGKYVSGWGTCDRISLTSAVEYLKEHRAERVFLSVMTADMHFPQGREDYADLTYPSPPEWVKGHPQEHLLTAISRFDHDLSRFFAALKAAGLWDRDTLVVVTADHAFPGLRGVESIPGVDLDFYQRIPFIIVSGQPLPEVDHTRLATQTATA